MFDKLKQRWEEDPMTCIVVGAFVIGTVFTAGAKLIDATSAAKGRSAYAKQVDYRVKNRY